MLWLASLFLPVAKQTELPGYLVLALGWYGVATGEIGWLANITFLVAIALLVGLGSSRPSLSFGVALMTTIFAATTLYWDKIFLTESEHLIPSLRFGAGYYTLMSALLLASISLAARTAVLKWRLDLAKG